MLQKVNLNCKIQGVQAYWNGPRINHLLFVGDLILFFKLIEQSFHKVNTILHDFHMASHLVVNKSKSIVWFSPNIPRQRRKEFVELLGIKAAQKFGKYVGSYIDHP